MTIRSNHEWYTAEPPNLAFCRHCGISVENVATMRNADRNLVCEHTADVHIATAKLMNLDAEYKAVVDQWNRLIASFWLPTILVSIPAIGQDSAMEVADDYQS